ncbi:MAG: ABC transporter permease [Clostridia bacterium]|nr:ABC transporter permease [Clostridia bacterium]
MKVRTTGYFFRQAFKSILRNFWMSVASVATVAICLFILGSFTLLIANTNYIAHKVESDVEIAVFTMVDATEKEVESVGERLEGIDHVSSIEFISKEKGLQQLNKKFGKEHDLLKALDGNNPLPDYYLVKAKEPDKVPVIVQETEAMPYVEKVNYGQGIVEPLFKIANWIRVGGAVTVILLAVCTVFLIAVTVRLTIFARRREINIMKFVGATNWFIRWPFFIEGLFLGLMGSAAACLVLYFSYNFLADKIILTFAFLPILKDAAVIKRMSLIVLGGGPLVGALGSMLSVHRFLQV